MPDRLCLVAAKPTDAVLHGFLPAAARLGLDVLLVTDRPAQYPDATTVACDVWDFRALIDCLTAGPAPDAVFTNSDHLQAQVALAAAYLGLPGKDWRSCLRAKHKPLMRRRLAQTGTEQVVCRDLASAGGDLPYPVVVKPADGVASEDVVLAADPAELARHVADIRARRPDVRLIAEQYLPGTLRTLETIGDGHVTWVLGGFRTDLSPPPFFIEERLTWDPPRDVLVAHVLRAQADLGVSFGACHTEFTDGGLIEVNDRLIGDNCDFLLTDLLGWDPFELTLRVHLGERLAASPPPPRWPAAVASYFSAKRHGVLRTTPSLDPGEFARPGVTLRFWPYARAGQHLAIAGSNRDYLGVLTAAGPGADAVQRSVAAATAACRWEFE